MKAAVMLTKIKSTCFMFNVSKITKLPHMFDSTQIAGAGAQSQLKMFGLIVFANFLLTWNIICQKL